MRASERVLVGHRMIFLGREKGIISNVDVFIGIEHWPRGENAEQR